MVADDSFLRNGELSCFMVYEYTGMGHFISVLIIKFCFEN